LKGRRGDGVTVAIEKKNHWSLIIFHLLAASRPFSKMTTEKWQMTNDQ